MKRAFLYSFIAGFLFLMNSCSSSNKVLNANSQQLMDSGKFSFVAEKANPTNLDVINIMNALPSGGAARMLDLSAGYYVNFSSDEISANLPYFGRMFIANMDQTKNNFDFKSKSFTVDTSKSTDKKTVWAVHFNDVQNVRDLFLEVYKNGKAYVSINANDRQAISYDGHISAIKDSAE